MCRGLSGDACRHRSSGFCPRELELLELELELLEPELELELLELELLELELELELEERGKLGNMASGKGA